MTINTCEGSHYECGEVANWVTSGDASGSCQQLRSKKRSFMLGETEIIVHQSSRNFLIEYDHHWEFTGDKFLMFTSDGDPFICMDGIQVDNPHSVSEDYRVTNTVLHFLDTRYNNAIGKEVREVLTFSYSGDEMAGFKEAWGIYWYPKFVITNHRVVTETDYFVVVNGVKTILKSTVEDELVNGADNPLILVYPNPPGQAAPWINCDDIKEFGFYDYFALE